MGFIFGLYAAFQKLAGFPLTQATIAWGALRIVPCFAYGCALHALWRARPAQNLHRRRRRRRPFRRRGARSGGERCPDAAIVTGLGALIFFMARMAQAGSETFSNGALVYLGEISYSVYMVCVPWKIVFVNGVCQGLPA